MFVCVGACVVVSVGVDDAHMSATYGAVVSSCGPHNEASRLVHWTTSLLYCIVLFTLHYLLCLTRQASELWLIYAYIYIVYV